MQRLHAVWPSWAVLAGLVFVFFGERAFAFSSPARLTLDLLATVCLLSALAYRAKELLSATEATRLVRRALIASTAGVVLSLALYALIPLALSGDDASSRAKSVVWALWPTFLVISAFPLAALELAVSAVAFNAAYETDRVLGALRRGLGLALLLAALFFLNLLAARHDLKWELSAGNRASPSVATKRAVDELTKDVTAILFFPRANEVGDAVERYVEQLTARNPRLTYQRVDQALASELAGKTRVTDNGWLALMHEGTSERIRIGETPQSAKVTLRRLDREVLEALLKVTVRKRVAYLTTGHGERAHLRKDEEDPRAPVTLIKKQLETWQFQVKPFGVAEGSTQEIPEDASVVMILGPEKPFLPAEVEVLSAALEKGARLLLALDPEADTSSLDPLLTRIGIRLDRAPLANAASHAPLSRTKADRAFIWSNRYSSHPSVTTMTRNSRLATVFGSPGSLERLEANTAATGTAAATGTPLPQAKLDVVLTAIDNTFRDVDRDLEKDAGEADSNYPLAAAMTRTSTLGPKGETRVFVLPDADVFADELIKLVQGNLLLFRDVVYWLQVDEEPIVPTVSEKDVRIVHKSDEDTALFYGTTFAAPLLVLGVGYLATRRRKAR